MRISNLGQVNPVTTAALLDAALPATKLAKRADTVNLGDGKGPDASSLMLLGAALFVGYIFISSTPPDPRGTIRGY